eukprot:11188999-Lingulodinium_polyedra.AAC.1
MHPFIHVSIHPHIHASIRPRVHVSIHPFIHASLHPFVFFSLLHAHRWDRGRRCGQCDAYGRLDHGITAAGTAVHAVQALKRASRHSD